MFDVHGFKPVSFENQPYGGHGYPGRTLDTLSGSDLDVRPNNIIVSKRFDARTSSLIRRRVRFAVLGLLSALVLLFLTIGSALLG